MTVLTFPSVIPSGFSFKLRPHSQSFSSPLTGSTQTLDTPGAALWYANIDFEDTNALEGRTLMAFLANLDGTAGRFSLSPLHHPTPAGVATGTPIINGGSCQTTSSYAIGETTIGVDTATRDFEVGEYVKFDDHEAVYLLVTGTVSGTLELQAGGLEVAVANNAVARVFHQGKKIKTKGWTQGTAGLLLVGDFFEINGELKIVTVQVDSDDVAAGTADIYFAPPLRDTIAETTAVVVTNPKATMRLMDDDQAAQDYYGPIITNTSISCVEAF